MNKPTNKGKLILLGAGPGDPELITWKGFRAIRDAKVILYDALVNPELLKAASDSALKISVGKRVGQHSFTQDEINELIVKYVKQEGDVIRLKGGDPYVFGRGYEEKEYAELHGIETEYIPGISSAVALTGLQDIPLTKRGINDGFWVITGTKSNGNLSKDVSLAVQSSATVVILMGLGKIEEIADLYSKEGRSNYPIAVIYNGSLPNEKIFVGKISNIVEKMKEEPQNGPGIIVIGEVVKLHPQYVYNFVNQNLVEQLREQSYGNY
jgi:uroporphyrin-III C-methyltransferase